MKEWVCKEYTTTMLNGNVFGGLQKEQELVRCKDCKNAVAQDCEQVWCSFVDDGLSHEPDWFCADGERRMECTQ